MLAQASERYAACLKGAPDISAVLPGVKMAKSSEIKHIKDLIADDYWAYSTADGDHKTSRVTIGRPVRWPGDAQGGFIAVCIRSGLGSQLRGGRQASKTSSDPESGN